MAAANQMRKQYPVVVETGSDYCILICNYKRNYIRSESGPLAALSIAICEAYWEMEEKERG
jgi:hypothetical protein